MLVVPDHVPAAVDVLVDRLVAVDRVIYLEAYAAVPGDRPEPESCRYIRLVKEPYAATPQRAVHAFWILRRCILGGFVFRLQTRDVLFDLVGGHIQLRLHHFGIVQQRIEIFELLLDPCPAVQVLLVDDLEHRRIADQHVPDARDGLLIEILGEHAHDRQRRDRDLDRGVDAHGHLALPIGKRIRNPFRDPVHCAVIGRLRCFSGFTAVCRHDVGPVALRHVDHGALIALVDDKLRFRRGLTGGNQKRRKQQDTNSFHTVFSFVRLIISRSFVRNVTSLLRCRKMQRGVESTPP